MQQISYHHFLITRFNLKQTTWKKDKHNNSLSNINNKWLDERWYIFEKYCFPSVLSQKNQNFKWLIYFDLDTPLAYKIKIETLVNICPHILPKFIQGMDSLIGNIKIDIANEVEKSNKSQECIILTSRVDNDDAIHEDYIDSIQKLVRKEAIVNGVVDIPNGFCLQIEPKFTLTSTIQFSNAFITYIEKYKSYSTLETVMNKPHVEWIYNAKTYRIKKKKLWLQIIHSKNVWNNIQGISITQADILHQFHMEEKIILEKMNTLGNLYNNIIKNRLYLLKKTGKGIYIKLRLFNRSL